MEALKVVAEENLAENAFEMGNIFRQEIKNPDNCCIQKSGFCMGLSALIQPKIYTHTTRRIFVRGEAVSLGNVLRLAS